MWLEEEEKMRREALEQYKERYENFYNKIKAVLTTDKIKFDGFQNSKFMRIIEEFSFFTDKIANSDKTLEGYLELFKKYKDTLVSKALKEDEPANKYISMLSTLFYKCVSFIGFEEQMKALRNIFSLKGSMRY